MKKLIFIHAADLHLDSPFKGLTHLPSTLFEEVRQSTFHAFDALIEQAIVHQIDFLLLVGDLFDHEEQSLKAQIHLRNAFLKLQTHDIQVYLSYGNHDFIQKNSHQVKLPENVFAFQNEKVQSFIYEKDGKCLAEIHGFSYEQRAVTESKINEYPVRNPAAKFHIGMLHGAMNGNTAHHAYAPFRMEELKEKAYDYWALGHIHQRAVLNEAPPIIYPGNIQGRHRKETGDKGCYLVEMTAQETNTTFIRLHQIHFSEIEMNLAGVESIEAAEKMLHQAFIEQKKTPMLIHFTWINVSSNQFGAQTEDYLRELIDVYNERAVEASLWHFIYKMRIHFKALNEEKVNGLFIEEAEKAFQMLDVQKEISDLIQHTQARRFLELPTDAELLKDAENILVRKLLQEK